MGRSFSIYLDLIRVSAAFLVYLYHSNQRFLSETELPFSGYGHSAVVVFFVVRWRSANPVWAALVAAIVTMVAFVGAVNAAIFIDGQMAGAAKAMRSLFAGLTGGLVGAGLMALGIARLPASPRNAAAWMPMLVTGAVAGSLLALDTALGLDRTSFLYPVWQAAVGVRLATVLRR